MRAVIYLRVSDPKQVEGTSLDTQETITRSYCASQGYNIVDTVRDAGISAARTNIARVVELLEYCRDNRAKFDVLVVFKLDRFARSQSQHHWLRSELLKLKIILRSASEPIGESGTMKLLEGVLAAAAEFDNEIRMERARLGMVRRLDEGLFPWSPPPGYYKPQVHGVRLSVDRIDENCRKATIAVFELFAQGYSCRVIAKKVNATKPVQHNGKPIRFSKSSIGRMVRNPFYIGFTQAKIDGRLRRAKHEPLIDMELWKACQQREKKLFTPHKKDNPDSPLRNLVIGLCNHPFTGAISKGGSGKHYPYYFCPQRHHSRNYNASLIHFKFEELLSRVQPDKDNVELFMEMYSERLLSNDTRQEEGLRRLNFDLANIKDRKMRLINFARPKGRGIF